MKFNIHKLYINNKSGYNSYKKGMNTLKKEGFTTLECIISMSILSFIVYIMTFSLNSNFSLLNKNEEYIKMLNLAQNSLNETKSNIKQSEDFKYSEIYNIDGFSISKNISKQDNYYNYYKLSIEVKSSDRSVELESYVTKK